MLYDLDFVACVPLGAYSVRQHIGWREEQREGREKELNYLKGVFGRRKEGETKEGKILC